MNKQRKLIAGLAVGILVPLIIGLFFIDVGINSKYFIKRDFRQAFTYRSVGDCLKFVEFVNYDQTGWLSKCLQEKTSEEPPVRDFKIQKITYELGSDKAFLQVELTRSAPDKSLKFYDKVYSVSYELKRVGHQWKIDQEVKK